jgi:hypothetical protein
MVTLPGDASQNMPLQNCGAPRLNGCFRLVPKHSQADRHFILLEFVAAAGAVLVAGAHRTEAVTAICRKPIIALRTEMEVAQYMRAARRASGNLRLAQ